LRKTFPCRLLERPAGAAVVLFVSTSPMQVADVSLPLGTVTFGHFWTDRPYNAYHWMSPAGATLGIYFNLADRTRIEPDGRALSWRDLTVDVLLRPDGRVAVLDEEDLPRDLDPATRATVERGKREITENASRLASELETAARRLWPLAFTGDRP
jgi:predicted RNA-binding protein associated with RNAse of E/G family